MQYIKQKTKINIQYRDGWLLGIAVLLWLILMFTMSSQNGAQSHFLSTSVVRFLGNIFPVPEELIDSPVFQAIAFELIFRKAMHFSEFFILSLLLNFFFTKLDFKQWKVSRTVLAVCLFFAVLDEAHQVFVRGRTPLAFDVIIDFAGAWLAVVAVDHFKKLKRRKDML